MLAALAIALGFLGPPGLTERRAVEDGPAQVRAPEAWARGHRGQGTTVGIIATGVDWDHPALKASYRGWDGATAGHDYSWYDPIGADVSGNGTNPCGFSAPDPCDDTGTGTSLAGVVAGDDGGANQIGVAPGARWIGCRALEENAFSEEALKACLQFMLAPTDRAGANPDPARRPDIVLMPVTCTSSCPDVTAGLDALTAAGVLVVGSAGNSGPGCGSAAPFPGDRPDVLTLGAVNTGEVISVFSGRGPGGAGTIEPDLVALGAAVRTATPGGSYASFSGTTFSAGIGAGVAALLLSSAEGLRGRPDELARLLRAGAKPLTGGGECGGVAPTAVPNNTFGHGRVDAIGAIDAYVPPDPEPTPSPTPAASATPGPGPTASPQPTATPTPPPPLCTPLRPAAGRRWKGRIRVSQTATRLTLRLRPRRALRRIRVSVRGCDGVVARGRKRRARAKRVTRVRIKPAAPPAGDYLVVTDARRRGRKVRRITPLTAGRSPSSRGRPRA